MNNIVSYVNPNVSNKEMGNDCLSLGLLAGVHGDELETILCANRIKQILDETPDEIMKLLPGFTNINILCCANMSGMKNKSRVPVDPKDDGDLNRGWGDWADSSDKYREKIRDLIESSDILIDMHCSNNMVSSGFLIDTDQNYAPVIIEWCQTFGIPFMVRDCNNSTIKKYVDKSCGKIGLTWEQPHYKDLINKLEFHNNVRFWMEKIFPAIPDLMKMKQVSSDEKSRKLTMGDMNYLMEKYRLQSIYAPASGIFVPTDLGCIIKNGSIIGDIICDDGSNIPIIAQKDGRIIFRTDLKYVKEGEWLMWFNQCLYN